MTIETVRHTPCPGCGHTEAQEEDNQTGRHRCLRCGLRFAIDERGHAKDLPYDPEDDG